MVAQHWGLTTTRLAATRLATTRLAAGDDAADSAADMLLIIVQSTRGDRPPWLLFDSHMDTVAIEGMTIDPFGGVILDGKLFGRGACDTKGTGAAMLWALCQYAQQSDRPNTIALLFSTDEEMMMSGLRRNREKKEALIM